MHIRTLAGALAAVLISAAAVILFTTADAAAARTCWQPVGFTVAG